MRYVKLTVLIILGLLITFAFGYTGSNVERGKKLFNDPTLGGSENEISCNTCHPDGKGLEKVGENLEDVINLCIERPLKGKPLDRDSQDMRDIVTYIKSLGEK